MMPYMNMVTSLPVVTFYEVKEVKNDYVQLSQLNIFLLFLLLLRYYNYSERLLQESLSWVEGRTLLLGLHLT